MESMLCSVMFGELGWPGKVIRVLVIEESSLSQSMGREIIEGSRCDPLPPPNPDRIFWRIRSCGIR